VVDRCERVFLTWTCQVPGPAFLCIPSFALERCVSQTEKQSSGIREKSRDSYARNDLPPL